MEIRRATIDDAAACAAIYAHYVETSNATFETVPPTVEEFVGRMEPRLASYDWLVADEGTPAEPNVVGYAYASAFRDRAAYDWAVETTIYLDADGTRAGTGSALYTELLNRLEAKGFHTALAVIALPNVASENFHRKLGFEKVSHLAHMGFKLGYWSDIAHYQRMLGHPSEDAPAANPLGR